MSKQEEYLANQIKIIAPKLFFHKNYRPDFLKNKKTDKNLEIDFWFPHFKVGIEYQGAVHFNAIGRFNNNPDDSRMNDVLKQEILLSFQNNYSIVEVFENDLKGNIKLNLFNRIDNTINFYGDKNRKFKSKVKSLSKFKKYLKYYTNVTPREMILDIINSNKSTELLLKDRYTNKCPICNERIDMPKIVPYNYRKGYIHKHECSLCKGLFEFKINIKYKTFKSEEKY